MATRARSSKLSASMDGQEVTVAGWVQDTRNLGGISFIQLRDRDGTVQLTLPKKKIEPGLFKELTTIPRESVIAVRGTLKANKEARAGFEIIPSAMAALNVAETPLPMGVIDKVNIDLDTRLSNRFMDLRREQVLAIFKVRDALLGGSREYLSSEGFLEVQTPKIVAAGAEGGATLFKLSYFGREAYLAQSPQLYKQSLMGAGFERIFEIAPAYRAELSDTVRHLSEFTSLDVEMSFVKDSDDVMKVVEGLVAHAITHVSRKCTAELSMLGIEPSEQKPPFPRLTHEECVRLLQGAGKKIEVGQDIDTDGEKMLGDIVKKEHGSRLYFITRFPTELKRGTFYAMRLDEDPSLTGYFDFEFDGEELVSGGQREHRLPRLIAQIEENDMSPEAFEFYLKAFRFGMPPHGGFGLGVERFLHMLLRLPNIRECVLFPRDRVRIAP
ncbi:MAG: aspartate--tRNA(Asn) ligase [Euryarchaeota archaeon]|nr:aspartate--tRNA(Asn) ligase [Euryarchaeota archaeon]